MKFIPHRLKNIWTIQDPNYFLFFIVFNTGGITLNKIITLTGHKNCGKELIARRLAYNSDIQYVRPYTDKKVTIRADEYDLGDLNYVSKKKLDEMIEEEEVLSITTINGTRYVFFKSQLTEAYNVLIADDYAVMDIKGKWKNIYTVKVYGHMQSDSDRVGEYLYDHEFDEVFNYDEDDLEMLEVRIE